MASTQILPQVSGLSKPAVLQFPEVSQGIITQRELAELRLLAMQADEATKALDEKRESIRQALEQGFAVEHGLRTARLEESCRRNVCWKGIVVRLAERLKFDGEAYCENVLSHTKPMRTVKLVTE